MDVKNSRNISGAGFTSPALTKKQIVMGAAKGHTGVGGQEIALAGKASTPTWKHATREPIAQANYAWVDRMER